MRYLIAFLMLAFATPALASYSITLDGQSRTLVDHPRIELTSSDLTAIRNRTSGNSFYTNMLTRIDTYMDDNWNTSTHTWASGRSCASMAWGETPGVLGNLTAMALYYLLYPNGTNDGVDAIEYGRYVKATLQGLADNTCGYTLNIDYTSGHLVAFARMWDWVYNVDGDDLIGGDTTFKDDFLTWINDTAIPHVETHNLYTSFTSFRTLPPESNLMITAWMGRLAIGLATYEDNEQADGYGSATHNSEVYLEDAWDWYEDTLMPFRNTVMQGGHGLDGSDYQLGRTGQYVLIGLEMLTDGISEVDAWGDVTGSWAEEQGLYNIYRSFPNFEKIDVEGSYGEHELPASASDATWARKLTDILYITNHYNSTASQQVLDWLIDNYDPDLIAAGATYHYTTDWVMMFDEGATTSDYTSLDESWFADGSDIFISRTGWGTSDTWTRLRAAPGWGNPREDEDHPVNSSANSDLTRGATFHTGSYVIFTEDEYLLYENISDGDVSTSNGLPGHYNINKIANSIENLFGSEIDYTTGMWGNGQATVVYDASSPTNYRYGSGSADIDRTVSGTATMRYARADLTDAYIDSLANGKVADEVYRSFVHSVEATGDNYVIIHDYIDKDASSGAVTSQLLYPGNPTVSGSTVTYTGSSARLVTNVLVPTSPSISKTDVATTSNHIDGDDTFQIDIPVGSSDKQTVLIVHCPSSDIGYTAPTISLIDETEYQGAFIADATRNRAVLFSKDSGPPASTISFTVTTTTDDVRIFVADLTASTTYYTTESSSGADLTTNIYLSDPGGSEPRTTDSSGTLTFLSGSSGDPVGMKGVSGFGVTFK